MPKNIYSKYLCFLFIEVQQCCKTHALVHPTPHDLWHNIICTPLRIKYALHRTKIQRPSCGFVSRRGTSELQFWSQSTASTCAACLQCIERTSGHTTRICDWHFCGPMSLRSWPSSCFTWGFTWKGQGTNNNLKCPTVLYQGGQSTFKVQTSFRLTYGVSVSYRHTSFLDLLRHSCLLLNHVRVALKVGWNPDQIGYVRQGQMLSSPRSLVTASAP